jgi:two-component system phosphate regulon sensor histidine kinase PhoR
VGTLLDAARIEQGVMTYSFTIVDLRELARTALESMRYQIRSAGMRIHFHPGRWPAKVAADPDALQLAVRNLLANAVKYAACGKYVGVTLRRVNNSVECRVEDRGPGIPEEALPHIFERFYRGRGSGDGARGFGLGLSLVRHVMEAHGGRVDVRSSRGKGTVMTLVFPPEERPRAPSIPHSAG